MTLTYSPQQEALFTWVREGQGNLFLRARAGTGKSTTLVGAVRHMRGSVALAAYNKAAGDDLRGKLAAANIDLTQVRAGTFHSFGWNALRRVYPQAKVDERAKREELLDQVRLPNQPDARMPQELQTFVMRLVSLAKQSALGLYGSCDDESRWWAIVDHHDLASDLDDPSMAQQGLRWAYQTLRHSNTLLPRLVDFDDMIYVPAVRPVRMWQNDWVLVDEAQDTNPARRALTRKMVRPGGRVVFVGDDRQAIYGFTGADDDAVGLIKREFSCSELPLTVTYRCPKAVVSEARELVPDYMAHESAPEGTVRRIEEHRMLQDEGLRADDAILCRKTSPLVSWAFRLISAGVACHVEGRDIGAGLMKLVNRWKVRTLDALRDRLAKYREREVEKLLAKGQEAQAESLSDRVDTLVVLMDGCADLPDLRRKIEDMFQDNARTLTLATVHRSKGREWPRVYLLGRYQFMPSPFARQEWQARQEQNLIYVAITRAQSELVYVDTEL